jgi:hypothetical protein
MTLPMAWKVQADGVYSSIQTSPLVLPDHAIATGSVDKNNATPLRGYSIDAGQVVNCASVDFYNWHQDGPCAAYWWIKAKSTKMQV